MVEILKKPSENRTLEEIQTLVKMTEEMPFFKRIGSKASNSSNLHSKCCKLLRYRMLPKGTAAMYFGDMPDCFYLILKGSAVVLLPKDPEIIYKEKEKMKQKFKKMQRNGEKGKEKGDGEGEGSPKSPQSSRHNNNNNENKDFKTITESEQEADLASPLYSAPLKLSPQAPNSPKRSIAGFTYDSPFIPSSGARHAIKSLQKVTKMMTFLNASSMGSLRQKLDKQSFLITSHMKNEVFNAIGMKIEVLSNQRHYFDGQVFRYYNGGVLGYGQSFGELGLLRKKPRAATILCLENTHFGILLKSDYESIYFDLQNQKLKNMINFFKSSLDVKFTNDLVTKYAYLFEKKKISYGEIIYKQGDLATTVFLIKKGEISLHKSTPISQDTHKEIQHFNSKIHQKSHNIAVGLLRKGDYFGEEEVLSGERRKFTTICVSSKATIFHITKQVFSFFSIFLNF